MANAAIYIPRDPIDLGAEAELHEPGGPDAHYTLTVGGAAVRLNVMPKEEVPRHIRGFQGWVDRLDDDEQRKRDAKMALAATKNVIALVTEATFEDSQALWDFVFGVAHRNDGYVFVYDSLFLANEHVLVGRMRERDTDEAPAAPPARGTSEKKGVAGWLKGLLGGGS